MIMAKRFIKNLLLVVCAFVLVMSFAQLANAQSYYPILKWTSPAGEAGRQDGSPLLSEEIFEYRVYQEIQYGSDVYEELIEYPMVHGLEDQHYTLVTTVDKTTCFVVTTVDDFKRESAYSSKVCYAWPNPPDVECTIIPAQ